ncbi:MAG: hypothetical protein PHZ09_06375 [Eubacteriales bacterium]|nr:hypothetical protein [Eubacteriales bacterium]
MIKPKNKPIRFIAPLLLCAALFACAQTAQPGQTPSETTGAVADPVVTEAETLPEPDLSGLDYDGHSFVMLTEAGYNWEEVDVSEEMGTVTNDVTVNDAVYQRNLMTEETLNVSLSMLISSSVNSDIKKAASAGDDAYGMVMPSTGTAVALALADYFYDWNDLEHVNLNMPWYEQGIIDDVTIAGRVLFMTGDFGFRDKDNTWIFMFNKNLLSDLNMTAPYDLVREGKWTLDVFGEMSKDVTADIDGNSKYDAADRYGFLTTGAGGAANFLYAGGNKIVTQTSDGIVLSLNNERTAALAEITNDIFNSENRTHTDAWDVIERMFAAGQGLFYSEIMAHVRNLRGMEADFGLLPSPKYDEDQEGYYCHVDAAAPLMCVINTVSEPERTSAVLEALYYYGYKYVRTAYYDVALTGKHIRDGDSAEMLDVILGGRVFDMGYIYNVGTLAGMMSTMISRKSSDFASYYTKLETKAQTDLDDIIAKISDMG